MSEKIITLFKNGGGEFISPPSSFIGKLKNIKGILFDWDGVFNNGFKKAGEGSPFSEVDAMGGNLLRYAFWKLNGALPKVAVITGENNPPAQALAEREHFHEIYFMAKNKSISFKAFCEKYSLRPDEVLFFFDDVLDLEVARQCGARIMIRRPSTVLLNNFASENGYADYLTANDGGHHGLREGCELVMGLLGVYDEVVRERSVFAKSYSTYVAERAQIETVVTKQVSNQ
jgi:3-deoxy-D-manno-octulosonate 8-phosphate phosphatase (KDO 8-P phosphatase)